MRAIDTQIEQLLTNCQIKSLSEKTIKSYSQTLFMMANYFEEQGITDAAKVRAVDITQYIAYLQKRGKYTVGNSGSKPGGKITKTTINNYIRNMRVFFNFLYDFDVIDKNPMKKIRQLKNDRQPLTFVTDVQFDKLMKAMDISKYHEYRDKVIIQLLLDSGMRIGECLAVRLENVNLQYNSIYLPWEDTKGKRARTVFFSMQMRKTLKLWLRHKEKWNHSELLFPSIYGERLAINGFEHNLKKYTERVGLPGVTPKTFRNNFAKRFLMSGGDIFTLSRLLGHSSVQVTEAAYLDLTDQDLRDKYQNYSPLMNKGLH